MDSKGSEKLTRNYRVSSSDNMSIVIASGIGHVDMGNFFCAWTSSGFVT